MLRYMLAAVAILFTLAPAQTIDRRKIDAAVERSMQVWMIPGAAVAIVHGDQMVYARGYGVRELGREDPVTPGTVFAVGSTTKAFTAAAVAMLVDDGKMAWDDPVRKHIEFFHLYDPFADRAATLRDLLSHRTGLSRNDALWYNSPWSREELLRRLA
jgi:CubicO group peptidase (beta-lactamase class C family)